MGSVRKVGNEYYVEFEARGLKYQQKAGTDEQKAHQLLKEIEEKVKKGEMNTIPRNIDISIFIVDFCDFVQQSYAIKTARRFTAAVRHFQLFLDAQNPKIIEVSQITPNLIEQYKLSLIKELSSVRVNRQFFLVNLTLLILSDLFNYAIRLGYLNDNPRLHIPLLKQPESLKAQYYDKSEVSLIKNHVNAAGQFLIQWILETGMRKTEIECLTWDDVDIAGRCVHVAGKRTIPLTAGAHTLIEHLSEMKKNHKKFLLRGYVAQSRLTHVQFYTLRNTFAQNLLRNNVSLLRLHALMGFADFARILKYLDFLPDSRVELYN